MKITPMNACDTPFQAKHSYYITKAMLEPKVKNRIEKFLSADELKTLEKAAAITLSAESATEILKGKGISYLQTDNDTIHAAYGYNGGFYSIKTGVMLEPELLKAYFAQELIKNNKASFGGLLNYKDMISNLKRQDLVQKGLQLHTYELNTEKIEQEKADMLVSCLSKLSNKYIKPKYLFYIGSDAFYYDKIDKTAYFVDAGAKTEKQTEATFRECRFNTDEHGNTIGYTLKSMDLFKQKIAETTYTEQQTVSRELPAIADSINNKLYAEAFRFGNTKNYGFKIKNAIPAVLNHLSKRVGVFAPNEGQLQVVKSYDKNQNIITNICYYDPTTGRSLVYNDSGKYLYQIEYEKDHNGNITSCYKY